MKVDILFCKPCGFEKHANRIADDIRAQFGARIDDIEVKATEKIATFEVFINDEKVFSKLNKGRFPISGEIEAEIMKRMAG